jgi:hypothetical protein
MAPRASDDVIMPLLLMYAFTLLATIKDSRSFFFAITNVLHAQKNNSSRSPENPVPGISYCVLLLKRAFLCNIKIGQNTFFLQL